MSAPRMDELLQIIKSDHETTLTAADCVTIKEIMLAKVAGGKRAGAALSEAVQDYLEMSAALTDAGLPVVKRIGTADLTIRLRGRLDGLTLVVEREDVLQFAEKVTKLVR